MKPKILPSIGMLFLATMLAGNSFAQETDMKKLPAITVTASKADVSEKVNKAFNKNFKDATDMKWQQLGERLLVNFFMNDQENMALFKKNGYIIYHISYGVEKNLPAGIRTMIKTQPEYIDYKIAHVFNVNQDHRNIWLINLEDKKGYIDVRVEDNVLDEVAHINKSL